MKRNRRLSLVNDPLELMLDTLSNVFGGIILIACLLALIPRHESHVSITAEHQARGEMIERRLAVAKEQLAEAEAAINEFEHKDFSVHGALEIKHHQLFIFVEKLRKDATSFADAELSNAELEALAKTGDAEVLNNELERLRRIAIEQEVMSKSILEKIDFLAGRLETLSLEIEGLKKGISQQLRFPRERGGQRDPHPVIVWGGAVYPLRTGANLRPNPAVDMEKVSGQDSFRASPIKGKGSVNPSKDMDFIAAIRAAKKKGGYISIYLYPDSHAVFRDLKAALFEEGIGYGIEFVPAFRTLTFGSDGTMPPEL